ncbi:MULTISPECIES: alpha/beta hydrolase [unclassified Rhodococcus (in: high G+C Gram-positive bacteria)]|uniref:alpha/beta hydrolase n=1 Tax=unclassified Rhodococcus (in: high G+C Gram-positive bacteria) TaxID=192944 RepID=UPI0021C20F9F|nr:MULTISPECIES: alpha/beta hydrolase [unclassified Rhodococcus (in: high G+C Gram-positive bacteria)]
MKVTFDSLGLECAADLYLPEGADPDAELPGIVLGHGFGMGKTSLVQQGRHFAAAGFAALSIDYRYFGESEGEPREKNFPLDKVEDYRNAISYLQSRPEVDADRIGIWGTSFSGGTVIHVAGVDRRVKAVVAQVPVSDGRGWLQVLRNPSQWEELLDELEADRRGRFAGHPSGTIPSIGLSGERAVLPWKGPRDTSMTTSVPMALESLEKVAEWRPLAFAREIAPRPALVIAGSGYDVIHPFSMALDVHAALEEPKELTVLPFEGMAFYGGPGLVASLAVATTFFRTHLGSTVAEKQKALEPTSASDADR